MRGRGTGLQAMASLRAGGRSGRWDSFWQPQRLERRTPYLHALPRPRPAEVPATPVPHHAPVAPLAALAAGATL